LSVALLMFSYLFLVISTFAVVKPVRSSLFLEQFGARNLPYVYLATAVLSGIIAWLQSKLFDRFHVVTVQALTYLFFISNLVLFWVAFRHESRWLPAAFFLWVNIFTVIVNSMFWMYADFYYNPREAKRLYGFINAGGTLGGIASGFAVAWAVKDVGTENMLLVCAGVLGACILLTYAIRVVGRERIATVTAEYVQPPSEQGQLNGGAPEGVRKLFASRYTQYIAIALGLSLVISNLIDYQFNVVVERTYAGQDAKTAFFATFAAWVNALSFILQFFLTSQLLKRLGVGIALLMLPLTLLGGWMWMGLLPGLGAAVFLKATDGSMRYSIEQSTRDILYLPLAARVRSKLKTLVDVFVQRLAKGVGALFILALTVWWAFGPVVLSYVAVILAAGWIVCAVLLRTEYRKQLAHFLSLGQSPDDVSVPRRLDRGTLAEFVRAVDSGDEVRCLSALHHLRGSDTPEVLDALRKLVREATPNVQARALWVLSELGDDSVVLEADQLLLSDSLEVQIGAFQYLCQRDPAAVLETAKRVLSKDDPKLETVAIACLANGGSPNERKIAREIVEGVLSTSGKDAVTRRIYLARALRHVRAPSAFHAFLRPLLQDSSPLVVREALITARHVLPRELVPLVIEKLRDPDLSPSALDALRVHGNKLLGTLRDHLEDLTVPWDVRCALPRVFAEAGTMQATTDLLATLQQPEPELRFHILKALSDIHGTRPDLRMDVARLEAALVRELAAAYQHFPHDLPKAAAALPQPDGASPTHAHEPYHQAVERVLLLLGLLYAQDQVLTAYRGLCSQNPQQRANAVELLDALLPPRWKKLVLPLVDEEVPTSERLRVAGSLALSTR
jgi:AAA family ATP:ADP antiporter